MVERTRPRMGADVCWWFMPIFGILFVLIVLFVIGRFFGGWGGFCGRPPADRDSLDELRKEIKALRDEVRELKNKKEEKT